MKNNRTFFFFPAIIVLAFLLRIYRLGLYDLWFDEVLCAFQRFDLKNILNGRILDSNPPLYFIILHFFTPQKASEFILRLPSAIFGTLTVLALYGFAKRFFDGKTALISGFLLAISPFHIYYSQEVKMYSLFILFSFLSVSFLILSIREDKYFFWAGFIISSTLNLYTHYYAILVTSVEIITFIIAILGSGRSPDLPFTKKTIKNCIASNVLILLFFSPWIPIMLREHFFKTAGFVTTWIPKPTLKTFFYTFKNFAVGFSSTRWNYLIAAIIFGFLLILGFFELYRKKVLFFFIVPFFFIPILTLFLVSQYRPIYLDRYLSFLIPVFCLIVSLGMSKFKPGSVAMLLLLITLFSVSGYARLYENLPYLNQAPGEHERIPIKPAVKYIEDNFHEGDIVGHSCRSTLLSFEYYSGRKQHFLAVNNFEKYPQGSAWNHSSLLPELVPDAIKGAKRIWLVLSWWDPLPSLDPISQELKNWMDKNYKQVSSKNFKGIQLYLYENIP